MTNTTDKGVKLMKPTFFDANDPNNPKFKANGKLTVESFEEALGWFKAELKDGKCSDDCPECNAMEFAIIALENYIKTNNNN